MGFKDDDGYHRTGFPLVTPGLWFSFLVSKHNIHKAFEWTVCSSVETLASPTIGVVQSYTTSGKLNSEITASIIYSPCCSENTYFTTVFFPELIWMESVSL